MRWIAVAGLAVLLCACAPEPEDLATTLPSCSDCVDGNAASVIATSTFTCAIRLVGELKCWGLNNYGQLGIGTSENWGDGLDEMGDALPAIELGSNAGTLAGVAVANVATCVRFSDGRLKCWGRNNFGQLGLGHADNLGESSLDMGDNLPYVELGLGRTVEAISAGQNHFCALLDNATVKCWGLNSSGQLGLGDTASRGDDSTELGDNLPALDFGSNLTVKTLALGSSSNHGCVILSDGTVKCWGENGSGQLGQGTISDIGNSSGEMGNSLAVTNLGTGATATALALGDAHSCAILTGGSVKCWGANEAGQLGLGDTRTRGDGLNEMGDSLPAVQLGTGRTAKAIAAGDSHTCVILDNDSVKCWGNNSSGQLGQGDTTDRGDNASEMGDNLSAIDLGSGRTAIAVSAGLFHTCVLLDNQLVKCWGENQNGQLGQNDVNDRGDQVGEMGDFLPEVDLGET